MFNGRQDREGSGLYWRIRIGIEFVKLGLWNLWQWIRAGGGPPTIL